MLLFLSTVGNKSVISYCKKVNVKPDSEGVCGRRPWLVLKHAPVFARNYGGSLQLGLRVSVLGTSKQDVKKSSSICEQRRSIAVPTFDSRSGGISGTENNKLNYS